MTTPPIPQPPKPDLTIQVFSVSAGLLGVCITVLGISRALIRRPMREISRDLLAVDALLFLLSCCNAYLSLRTEGPIKRAGSWAADLFFLAGLLLMTAVCGLIAYSTV